MAIEVLYHNAVAAYDGEDMRNGLDLFAGASNVLGRSRSGVKVTSGTDLEVTVSGSTATIKVGRAYIDGNTLMQGGYLLRNTANFSPPALGASHATQTRYDIVYAAIQDSDLGQGAGKLGVIAVAQGTPSASPVEPTGLVPVNAIQLARLTVPPAAGTITVLDRRPFLAAAGGTVRYPSGIPTDLPDGVPFYLTGTGKLGYMHSGVERWLYDPGTAWVNLSLSGGFETASGDTPQMLVEGYRRTLRGQVQRTGAASFVGNTHYTFDILSAGDRPPAAYEHQYPVITSLGATQFAGVVKIDGTTGNVRFIMPTNNSSAFIALDGISWTTI